jgi:hypothetical protein
MRLWLVCTIVVAALLSGCDSRESQIVGKWKVAGGSETATWEFSANKAVDMSGRKGKYTFGDQGRLKVQTQTATFMYQLQLSDDRMTLTEPNGTKIELQRVK